MTRKQTNAYRRIVNMPTTVLPADRRLAPPERRGNVLVLVAGILVLLLITGISYLSRTRTERRISVAQRDVGRANDAVNTISRGLASEIGEALLPRPANSLGWDPFGSGVGVGTENPNLPRLAIAPTATRYEIADADRDGVPDQFWNRPAFEVVPWTNWPDVLPDPFANPTLAPRFDDIPGNPGTNDNRWLADAEPQRWYALFDASGVRQNETGADGNIVTPDIVEFFSHWQHLSNPMRPGNGWMVVPFTDDVAGSIRTFTQTATLGPYGTPFEQWLPHTLSGTDIISGAAGHGAYLPADFQNVVHATGVRFQNFINDPVAFENRWEAWFVDYQNAYRNLGGLGIPGNYYRLADVGFDLEGDGINEPLEVGERPQDAFIGPGMRTSDGTLWPDGTPRWNVERVLADADGDGWTDSFWFEAPVSPTDNEKTLVALRVVDLSGKINVNTATQFVRGRPEAANNLNNHGTRGHTPADVALSEVIQPGIDGLDFAGQSFLTNWEHGESIAIHQAGTFPNSFTILDGWYPDGGMAPNADFSPWGQTITAFDPAQWQGETDLLTIADELNFDNDTLKSPLARLDYWRRSGLLPNDSIEPMMTGQVWTADAFSSFTMADELELRSTHASNSPWTMSRLERAFQEDTTAEAFLRISPGREETTPYMDQLRIQETDQFPFDQVLHDKRRMLTTYNGARNETMPPWMWWEYRWNEPGFASGQFLANFLQQNRLKLDLREERGFVSGQGPFSMPELLPWRLLTAMSDALPTAAAGGFRHYYGADNNADFVIENAGLPVSDNAYLATGRLTAALAANLLEWRDADSFYGFDPATGVIEDAIVRIPLVPGNGFNQPGSVHPTEAYLGMEKQPFLVEAFIAHVHEAINAQFAHPAGNGGEQVDPGDNVIVDDSPTNDLHETVVAVEIANPYTTPLPLDDGSGNAFYKIEVFGQEFLPIGTIPVGESVVFYSAPDVRYLDALDIESPATFVSVNGVWSQTRSLYDSGNEERGIELIRIARNGASVVDLVIDRIDVRGYNALFDDDFAFGEAVSGTLENDRPQADRSEPPPPQPWDDIINIDSNTHWAQYVRVSREWEVDLDFTAIPTIEDDERAPRYVFSIRDVEVESNGIEFDKGSTPDTWFEDADGRKPTKFLPEVEIAGTFQTDFDPDAPRIKFPEFASLGQRRNGLNLGDGTDEFIDVDFAMQMLQKDGDFEQLGELYDIFMYGHLLAFQSGTTTLDTSGNAAGTLKTFSEHMIDGAIAGMDRRVNRLRIMPEEFQFWANDYVHSQVVGLEPARDNAEIANLINIGNDTRIGEPDLPAGARVLDAFILDSAGWNWNHPLQAFAIDTNENGTFYEDGDRELLLFRNAAGGQGRITPGLINLNTAYREVLRALPHFSRLVHETNLDDNDLNMPHLDWPNANNYLHGRVRVPEAIEIYRNQQGYTDQADLGMSFPDLDFRPPYGARGRLMQLNVIDPALNLSRGERGFASIGELGLLTREGRPGALPGGALLNQWADGYSIEAAGKNLLRNAFANDASIVDVDVSIDTQDAINPVTGLLVPDETATDSEELNRLLAGASNLITTRSDVFGVWFKVRVVRQDPTTGLWDATRRELIVSESRYFMIVDRSEVNSVSDRPKIVLLEKVSE